MALSHRVFSLLGSLLLAACGPRPEPVQQVATAPTSSGPSGPELASQPEPTTPAVAEPEPPEPEPEPVVAEPLPPPRPPPLFVDRTSAPASTSCRMVAHIGDSTSTGMMSEAYVKDPTQRLDAQYARIGVEQATLELFGGRSLVEHKKKHENGVMVAQRLRDAGYTGCWVIGLGTCDAANVAKDGTVDRAKRIERLMAIIGDEPVLWIDAVTIVPDGYWSAANMTTWNYELAAQLSRYPNARIYRWSADMREEWFVDDGIHYTSKGYTARAGMVADALAAAFPGPAE